MIERLPLFPLGTVLFPGLVLPLHIFEERYRMLVRDLLEIPSNRQRRFGVVAIQLGHEVGDVAARRLAPVGCTAELRGLTPHDDGRFDVVTSGKTRFRIESVDDSLPYLQADVTPLPDELGPGAETAAEHVARLFRLYCQRLAGTGAEVSAPTELPEDPIALSYLIAASVLLDRSVKQRLLEADHAAARLRLEYDLLRRENRLLETLPTVPAWKLMEEGVNPN